MRRSAAPFCPFPGFAEPILLSYHYSIYAVPGPAFCVKNPITPVHNGPASFLPGVNASAVHKAFTPNRQYHANAKPHNIPFPPAGEKWDSKGARGGAQPCGISAEVSPIRKEAFEYRFQKRLLPAEEPCSFGEAVWKAAIRTPAPLLLISTSASPTMPPSKGRLPCPLATPPGP